MPNNITHKTSTTAGAVPTAAQLTQGELAVNAASGKVYTKKVDGTIVELTDLQVMDGGEQFSPLGISNLALWLDASDTSTLYTSELGAVSAVTSPTEITGCVGWWDASDASNITQSGGLVSQLNDKSGLGNHATASGTARPTLTANGLNGRSVLTFDGTNTVMRVAANAVFNSNDITYFVVFRQVSSANAGVYTKLNTTTGTVGFGFVCRAGTPPTIWPLQKNANLAQVLNLSAFDPTTGVRVYSVVSSSTASAYVNGAFVVSNASAADHSLNQRVSIGARDSSEILNGYIAEIIHFNVALSDADRARIEKYLAIKWGLTDPYQSVAQATTAATSPLDVGNCALWLDASDAATVTLSAGSVTQWTDKSGNARHFTASSTACPAYAATINGRSVLTFDGVANTLTGNAAAQTMIQNITGYTCFAVTRFNSVAAGERFVFGLGSTVIYRLGQQDSRPFIGGRRTGAETLRSVTAASGTLTTGTTYVLSSVVNHPTTTLTGFSRGVSFGTDAAYMDAGSTPTTALPVSVGTQGGGTYGFFNGDIAEIIVFNTALSSSDRARIEKYLANKWGGTSGIEPTPVVGAWYDKSGNARHFSQATTANRPTSGGALNALNVVSFDGTNDELTRVFASHTGMGNADGGACLFVFRPSNDGSYTVFTNTASSAHRDRFGDGRSYPAYFRGSRLEAVALNLPPSNATGLFTHNVRSNANFHTFKINGLLAHSAAASTAYSSWLTQSNITYRVGNGPNNDNLLGVIAEILHYAKPLTDTEIAKLETYLAVKWGITLAPSVSNVDAQDWVSRVYSAGGAVSKSTATAVNNFCNAIDSAGLRDRFYRLNLFCGNDLTTCLVPLYRGPSLTGTQYGNTTDTNVNFSTTDYVETGSGGGLVGNGSNKYLQLGIAPSAWMGLSLGSHITVYKMTSVNSGSLVGSSLRPADSLQNQLWEFGAGGNAAGGPTGSFGAPGTYNSLLGVTREPGTGTAPVRAFRNDQFSADNSGGITPTGTSIPFAVFARNVQTTDTNAYSAGLYSNQRLAAYSVGLHLTNANVLLFNTAMQTFQAALSRAVT